MKKYNIIYTFIFVLCGHLLNATTYTVINSDDAGAGSLRQAILDANANAGPDVIVFSIPGAGVHTIQTVTALPTIQEEVIIDGSTQPAASCPDNLLIEIDGGLVGTFDNGLQIDADSCTIRGLIINASPRRGIRVIGSNHKIECNWIGTDNTGLAAKPNGNGGVIISPTSFNCTIGGYLPTQRNVISGNLGGSGGIYIADARENYVLGNYIGIDKLGINILPNFGSGVTIAGANSNHIGDTLLGAGNIIYIDFRAGVDIASNSSSMDSDSNFIQGNYIGVNVLGDFLGSVNASGVLIRNFFTAFGGQVGDYTTIGSNNPLGRNIFGGLRVGIDLPVDLFGGRTIGDINITIKGNYIGVSIDGETPVPNMTGIYIGNYDYKNSIIGGPNPGDGNIISGSSVYAIDSDKAGNIACIVKNLKIQGNYIGVDKTGTIAVPNERGINFGYPGKSSSSNYKSENIQIGGYKSGERNIISGNIQDGIVFSGDSSENISIINNFIGTDVSGGVLIPNGLDGIVMGNRFWQTSYGKDHLIDGNLVAGNGEEGIYIIQQNNVRIKNNVIGLDVTQSLDFGNQLDGIFISNSYNNTIDSNIIANNNGDGIYIEDVNSISNNIAINSIFCNTDLGININGEANINKSAPTVIVIMNCLGVDTIRGTALPGDIVEIYYDDLCAPSCQGKEFIRVIVADGSGNYEYTTTLTHQYITATARDGAGNTSEFGCPVDVFTLSSDSSECLGVSKTLTANGTNVISYLWSPGGATTAAINVSPDDTTTYVVQGLDAGGCILVIDSVKLNVIQEVAIGLVDETICDDSTLVLDATIPGATYLWSTTATTPTITAAVAGQYSVEITHNNPFNCISKDTMDLVLDEAACVVVSIDNLRFEAQITNGKVKLDWSTENESNTENFKLEKSKDGKSFEEFNTQEAAGFSTDILNYVAYDYSPYSGRSYYRLKQVDEEGTYTYSQIREIYIGNLETVKIYPNPAERQINLEFHSQQEGSLQMVILNAIGQQVTIKTFKLQVGKSTIGYDVSELKSGTYLFKLITSNGEFVTKEFLVR